MSEPLPELTAIWRTPIGPMRGILTAQGVRALHFPALDEQILDGSAGESVRLSSLQSLAGGVWRRPGSPLLLHMEALTAYLLGYFHGMTVGDAAPLDWTGCGVFDVEVWRQTRAIARGRTMTYGELARDVGRPGAARAVGGALGRNPLVLLVPCHRVLSANAKRALGGFSGGLALKRHLLLREGISLDP
jgi:methylated-DNA-[protein]-cysteine S-methyltransferase